MDLMIVMQDWDFPHFTNTLDVNLPGFYKHQVTFNAVEIQISGSKVTLRKMHENPNTFHLLFCIGKWFNYGIIFLVMLFDLNMWKNQIFYAPVDYAQSTDEKGKLTLCACFLK